MSDRLFVVTVDTEPDSEWERPALDDLSFNNVESIPRFHSLCRKYQFVPTYLVDYQMAKQVTTQIQLSHYKKLGECEIGLHLHPWSTPPYNYEVSNCDTAYHPFLTQYPIKVFDKKMENLVRAVREGFKVHPQSFRAGRYVISREYALCLVKHGVTVDCSVTPLRVWEPDRNAAGSDYRKFDTTPFFWDDDAELLEIPLSAMQIDQADGMFYQLARKTLVAGSFKDNLLRRLFPNIRLQMWGGNWLFRYKKYASLAQALEMFVKIKKPTYVQAVLHSSEFHLGSCFKKEKEVDDYFRTIEQTFHFMEKEGYVGVTLQEAASQIRSSGIARPRFNSAQ